VLATGSRTMGSGPLLSKFTTVVQNFGYVTDCSYAKIRNVKRKIFWHFSMSSEIISFLMKKVDISSKKKTY